MEHERLPDVAPADQAADPGWEPPDWPDVLRRHRRRQLALAAGLVLLFFVVTPLLRWTVLDRPWSWTHWVGAGWTLLHVAETVHSRVSAAGRAS